MLIFVWNAAANLTCSWRLISWEDWNIYLIPNANSFYRKQHISTSQMILFSIPLYIQRHYPPTDKIIFVTSCPPSIYLLTAWLVMHFTKNDHINLSRKPWHSIHTQYHGGKLKHHFLPYSHQKYIRVTNTQLDLASPRASFYQITRACHGMLYSLGQTTPQPIQQSIF